MDDVKIRRDYHAEPGLLDRVMRLLGRVFPFVPEQVRHARRLGLDWSDVSVPFVVTKGPDRPVLAHVGVLELPLVIEGETVVAAGLHAVATHPDHRRQGLYRRIMEVVLPYVRERYELALLSTDRPVLYEPFGFRRVEEWRFGGPAHVVTRARDPLRRLDYDDPDDVVLLNTLLREREPISPRFGLVGERSVFQFNQAKAPPHHAEDLDALLVFDVEDRTLKLYDVVARAMPDLDAIVSSIPEAFDRVEVYFDAEALGGKLVPEPHLLDGDDHLCALGLLACEGRPFLWPRPYRC